jgi:hypothetical protein
VMELFVMRLFVMILLELEGLLFGLCAGLFAGLFAGLLVGLFAGLFAGLFTGLWAIWKRNCVAKVFKFRFNVKDVNTNL